MLFKSSKKLDKWGILIIITIILLSLAIFWCLYLYFEDNVRPEVLAENGVAARGEFSSSELARVEMDNAGLLTEVADTPDEWQRGLSGRSELKEDRGMLFDFPSARERTFWMKDTYIPLDIIWLYEGRVAGISANTAPQSRNCNCLPATYHSPGAVDMVLEVNAGWAKKHGLTKGDVVNIDKITE